MWLIVTCSFLVGELEKPFSYFQSLTPPSTPEAQGKGLFSALPGEGCSEGKKSKTSCSAHRVSPGTMRGLTWEGAASQPREWLLLAGGACQGAQGPSLLCLAILSLPVSRDRPGQTMCPPSAHSKGPWEAPCGTIRVCRHSLAIDGGKPELTVWGWGWGSAICKHSKRDTGQTTQGNFCWRREDGNAPGIMESVQKQGPQRLYTQTPTSDCPTGTSRAGPSQAPSTAPTLPAHRGSHSDHPARVTWGQWQVRLARELY